MDNGVSRPTNEQLKIKIHGDGNYKLLHGNQI
jgi:hypothetical protein